MKPIDEIKVKDHVWSIWTPETFKNYDLGIRHFYVADEPRETKVCQIVYSKKTNMKVFDCKGMTLWENSYGQTWFATKEEAEERIKEVKGGGFIE